MALLGISPAIQAVQEQIERLAGYPEIPVLVHGPTGVGKEIVARALHERTYDAARPFVDVNCAALPSELIESELFGHEMGAFSGAQRAREGLLEAAAGGTIFLDEVGEMPPLLQPKLLRALEQRAFRRIGGNRPIALTARVVSATNREFSRGSPLRRDLFYRLAGFIIHLPALRNRVEDVPVLAEHFLREFGRLHGTTSSFDEDAVELLCSTAWPGNVRELRAVVVQAAVLASSRVISRATIAGILDRQPSFSTTPPPRRSVPVPATSTSLREVERERILAAYARHDGNILRTAEELGIARSTLRQKLKRYGLI